jgi:hypothetical protein
MQRLERHTETELIEKNRSRRAAGTELIEIKN